MEENTEHNGERSRDHLKMEELLKQSAEMKARHQQTMEKVDELKTLTDELLKDSPIQTED